MFYLNKQKLTFSIFICLFLGTVEVFACVCDLNPNENINDSVKNAVKQSTVVFSGKVIGFEYHKGIPNEYMDSRNKQTNSKIEYETLVIKFQVERAWKGNLRKEIFLVTNKTKNSDGTQSGTSCDIDFKLEESYLVYAYGKENELKTGYCTRTKQIGKTPDLKILGEGKLWVEKEEKTKLN